MTVIYVDADACPVKTEVVRVSERNRIQVHFVSNQRMRTPQGQLVSSVVVSDHFDAADDWIVAQASKGDIVITADIPLASRCIEKGARVIGPTGKPFDEDSIGMAMVMRDMNAYLRDSGEMMGSGVPFSKKDRSRFLGTLENEIQMIRRG